ncbi:class I SAM-dependent methyltransferase [uncultured Roseobacter sp.]|uniref:class I SAM-dependent methyltransferase n=1 Tax=uncultured Roseobacter sp. TaxID=114847 RepID=UPI002634BD4C|nr:class I SAM-dependent methyltransferase [uncultured Roseobacter sp.]
MHIRRQSDDAVIDPSNQQTIPMTNYRFGSWQVTINRQPRAKEDLARQYDAASRNWQQKIRRYGLAAAYRRSLMASGAVTALGKVGSQARVLDCGVGSGALSTALSSILSQSLNFCGIDLSAEMLARADVEMRQAGLAPDLRQADILSIPYNDATFDVVMAAHVLEHLPNPQLALNEMIRVLKPGGMLFVCLVRRSGFGAFIQMRWRTWAITERQGVAWLRACHLENIGCQPIRLGSCAGQASTAFWARRSSGPGRPPETASATEKHEGDA